MVFRSLSWQGPAPWEKKNSFGDQGSGPAYKSITLLLSGFPALYILAVGERAP